jgi:hypothetical protein
MRAITEKALSLSIMVLFAVTSMACLNISPPDRRENKPRETTTVGGSKGVVVEHGGGAGANVTVGGNKGVVVDH